MEPANRLMRLWWLPALALLCATGQEARGHAFRNPPGGARALAESGGKAAWIDDASAVTHNPANLAGLQDAEFLGSLTLVYGKTDFTTPWGAKASTESPWSLLPNLYAAWPLEDRPAVFGIGVTTPFGQATEWKKDAPFSGLFPYYARMQLVDVNPALAWQWGEQILLAAGVDLYWSDMEMRQVIPWSAALGIPGLPDGEARVDVDDTALGANAALTWLVSDRQRLALVYRSGFTMDYRGHVTIASIPPMLPPGAIAPRSRYQTEFIFPAQATLGYGLKVGERVTLGMDLEWIEFSRFKSMPIDAGRNAAAGLFPEEMRQDLKDVWTLGLALGWQYTPEWTLRAGYQFLESPVPDRTHTPLLPDADKHVLSMGLSREAGAHALDLAYAYSIFEDREVREQPHPLLNGSFELHSHLFSMSYRRRF